MVHNVFKRFIEVSFVLFLAAIIVVGVTMVVRGRPVEDKPAKPASSVTVQRADNESSMPESYDINKWVLVFDDEFNQKTLDRTKWSTCYEWYDKSNLGCTNSGNNELQWYLDEQVKILNGNLVLTAEAEPIDVNVNGTRRTYPYRSGMVSTGRPEIQGNVKWQGMYGYYEAKMKVQSGQGIWPAFWLLPTDKQWPPEIDIMEFLGHKTNEILQTYHWENDAGQHQEASSRITGDDFTKDWHLYAVDWQPGKINWYIDGKLTKTAKDTSVPNEPMQIILNQAIGGKLPGSPDATTTFPSTVLVDYVHAYAKKQ